jgi:hypothetical protein
MADDWNFQASFKFGPHSGSMLNVRAESPDDLIGKCGYLATRLADVATFAELQSALEGLSTVQAVQNVQAAMPGVVPLPQPVQAPQQQPAGWGNQANVVPVCAHGPMKDYVGKFTKNGQPYRNRYYCSSPFNTPREQQCPPQG